MTSPLNLGKTSLRNFEFVCFPVDEWVDIPPNDMSFPFVSLYNSSLVADVIVFLCCITYTMSNMKFLRFVALQLVNSVISRCRSLASEETSSDSSISRAMSLHGIILKFPCLFQ